jgi:hypothetical protein
VEEDKNVPITCNALLWYANGGGEDPESSIFSHVFFAVIFDRKAVICYNTFQTKRKYLEVINAQRHSRQHSKQQNELHIQRSSTWMTLSELIVSINPI